MNKEYKNLVASILKKAVDDFKDDEMKDEILVFVRGSWCRLLCESIDLNYKVYRNYFLKRC